MIDSLAKQYCVAEKRVFWIDGFLDADLCRQIRHELRFSHWYPSHVYQKRAGQEHRFISPLRTSVTTNEQWFTPQLLDIVHGIDCRLEGIVPGIRDRREQWQATRYSAGARFGYHFDSGARRHEAAGERVFTVMFYLNTPRRGGETRFRRLGIDVKAVAGRLLVFRNLTSRAKIDEAMLHASAPIVSGTKTILITWIRQRTTRKELYNSERTGGHHQEDHQALRAGH
jgi:prolyl 4-hydroxylase